MEFITDNYIIFLSVGFFIIFALIGYLVDTIKNNNNSNKNELPSDLKEITSKEEIELNNEVIEKNKIIENTTVEEEKTDNIVKEKEQISDSSNENLLDIYNEQIKNKEDI